MRTYAPTPHVTRVFVPPPCSCCGAELVDADGLPCWDVVGACRFICREGCREPMDAARARKAALS